MGADSQHKSRYHRPKGFARYMVDGSDKFVTSFCNDSVKSDRRCRNGDTNGKCIHYRDYRSVNYYYKSWNIEGVTSDDSLYWKYTTYQVTKNQNRFFPAARQPDVSSWRGISKSEAIKIINSLFHLDGNTIAKNEDGFHYIKTSSWHFTLNCFRSFFAV